MLPERMHGVFILCKSSDETIVIDRLAQSRLVHLMNAYDENLPGTTLTRGGLRSDAQELSKLRAELNHAVLQCERVRCELKMISQPLETKTSLSSEIPSLSHHLKRAQELVSFFSETQTAIATIDRNVIELRRAQEVLSFFVDDLGFVSTLFASKRFEHILVVPTAPFASPQQVIAQTQLLRGALLLTLQKEDSSKVLASLREKKHTIIDISCLSPERFLQNSQSLLPLDVVPSDLASQITDHLVSLARQREQLQRQLIADDNEQFLLEMRPILTFELLKAEAPKKFSRSARLTVIKGFVPTKKIGELRSAVPEALVETFEVHDAPTLLRNPKPTKSFEALLDLYSIPKYNELDPTRLMAITFPIFFGFMLGDVGYGLSALITSIYVRMRFPRMRRFTDIFLLSAIAAVAFGFLYGEFFGQAISGFTPVIHRTTDIALMSVAAIGVGILHINLGLVLSIFNDRDEGIFFALFKKAGWIFIELGALLIAAHAGLLHNVPVIAGFNVTALMAYSVLGIGVVLLIWSHSVAALLELPTMIGNVLSYIRLCALGLSSVWLAIIVNDLAHTAMLHGGVWIAFGVCILLLGHALNLALGLLGPFMHALRLHYVEFFGKFYQGGGTAYSPFGCVSMKHERKLSNSSQTNSSEVPKKIVMGASS